MAQDALFGMVDGDARMFDLAPYGAERPADVQRPRRGSFEEEAAETRRLHDLWAERLGG